MSDLFIVQIQQPALHNDIDWEMTSIGYETYDFGSFHNGKGKNSMNVDMIAYKCLLIQLEIIKVASNKQIRLYLFDKTLITLKVEKTKMFKQMRD